MSERIAIFGAGGHTRSVISIFLEKFKKSELLIIDFPRVPKEKIMGVEILSEIPKNKKIEYFVSIGNNQKRKEVLSSLSRPATFLVSKTATILTEFEFEKENNCICKEVFLGPEVKIGRNVIINTRALVEHDVIIGNHSHIGPNAVLCGSVKIGDDVFIGANATVRDGITICSDVLVGASSVVISDITQPGIYAGNPIRKLQ